MGRFASGYAAIHRHIGGLETAEPAIVIASTDSPPHRRLRNIIDCIAPDGDYSPPHRRLRNSGWDSDKPIIDSPPHRRLRN